MCVSSAVALLIFAAVELCEVENGWVAQTQQRTIQNDSTGILLDTYHEYKWWLINNLVEIRWTIWSSGATQQTFFSNKWLLGEDYHFMFKKLKD